MAREPKPLDPIDLAVADLLRYAVENLQLTYLEIQDLCGIKTNRLGIILRGERPATLGEVDRICTALEIDTLTLIAAAYWKTTGHPPTGLTSQQQNQAAQLLDPTSPVDYYSLAAKTTDYDIRAQIEAEQEEP